MEIASTKCNTVGHKEFLLYYDADRVVGSDVVSVLSGIERTVLSGTRYRHGETLQIGWVTTQIVDIGEYFTILEPDFRSLPLQWTRSINSTISITRMQRDICDSYAQQFDSSVSMRTSCTIESDPVDEKTMQVIERFETGNADSGWHIGYAKETDGSSQSEQAPHLIRVSLYEAGVRIPNIVQFLALPVGTRVVITGLRFRLFINDVELLPDIGSYAQRLLSK